MPRKVRTAKIRFFKKSRYLSRFWIFWTQIFSKYLISWHILIIWWEKWVLLTIIFPLQFWLSLRVNDPWSTPKLKKDQGWTEYMSAVLAHLILKFSSNIIFMIYFYNLKFEFKKFKNDWDIDFLKKT